MQRPLNFIKHLGHLGFQSHVVSVAGGAFWAHDATLLASVPAETQVLRTGSFEFERLPLLRRLRARQSQPQTAAPKPLATRSARTIAALRQHLLLPDAQIGWLPFALRAAQHICRNTPIDAVLTTSAPYSAHLVGLLLKKKLGLPWLADFRDAWSADPMQLLACHGVHRYLERQVVTAADRVVGVTQGVVDSVVNHDEAKSDKYHVIENGFAAEDFAAPMVSAAQPDSCRWRIAFVGSLYGKITLRYFFSALAQFLAAMPQAAAVVEVRLIGQIDRQEAAHHHAQLRQLNLGHVVSHAGYLAQGPDVVG